MSLQIYSIFLKKFAINKQDNMTLFDSWNWVDHMILNPTHEIIDFLSQNIFASSGNNNKSA